MDGSSYGRLIAKRLSLAVVCEESELLLQLRAPPPPADPHAVLRTALATSRLRDFSAFEKVGGRDVAAIGGAAVGYSQHGVCSYVYKAAWPGADGDGGTVLAIKVAARAPKLPGCRGAYVYDGAPRRAARR
eukprot:SAG11_NODE_6425_length_1316_cov_4.319638_2_plen_131_part_00